MSVRLLRLARIDELRKLYRDRRAAATRKIGRARRQGVELANTPFDPRMGVGAEQRMNSRKLQTELRKLNGFVDRRTQFVKLRDDIVPREQWMRYKKPEQIEARIARKERERMRSLRLVDGTTLGERDTMLANVMGGDQSVHKPFTERNRRPQGVQSLKALNKLIAQQNERVNPNYKSKRIKSSRVAAEKMFKGMGNDEAAKRVKQLDDERFYIAWVYGGLADETATNYVSLQSDGFDPDEGFLDTQNERISELIDWAEQIDLNTYGHAAPVKKTQSKRKR